MHTITHYDFGKIQINDRLYYKDLIIFQEEIITNWWRKKGHSLHLEDLQEVLVLSRKPEILIIGTGYNGVMKVPKSLIQQLEERGITIIVAKSKDAVKKFNELTPKKQVAIALHLTC